MKKELNLNKKVIIGVLLLTIILIISFTYALFTKTLTSDKAISIKSGSKYVGIYGENKNNIELNNTYTFTIENRGIVDSGYEVYLVDDESNTVDLSKVTYTVNNQTVKTGLLSDAKTDRVITSGILKTNETKTITLNIATSASGTYRGRLKIVSTDYFVKEDFDYTGDSQTFTVPTTGTYKIELWGAQGGDDVPTEGYVGIGGLGSYTSGYIQLNKNKNLYFYVGEMGIGTDNRDRQTFNGGALSWGAGSGGGATDIRLVNGEWSDFNSLKTRIIVAGAGGGSENSGGHGGTAGGLIGYDGVKVSYIDTGIPYVSSGGTQTSGYTFGGNGLQTYNNSSPYLGIWGGGGSGYYSGLSADCIVSGGGGGSSFISGHDGCDAIKEESTESNIIHTGQSIHYSGYKFTDTVMIDGAGYKWTTEKQNEIVGMPSHDGITTITGNSGNGYAKITFIGQ